MKTKITKSLLLPLLYGIISAWIAVGGIGIAVLLQASTLQVWQVIIGMSGIILLAVIPALHRGAWVYSNVRKHHTAEYFYELGNGIEASKAVEHYEKKVRKAIVAWMKLKLMNSSFGALFVGYFMILTVGFNWYMSLMLTLYICVIVVAAIYAGMQIMLLSARKLSYDKYGNIKNN